MDILCTPVFSRISAPFPHPFLGFAMATTSFMIQLFSEQYFAGAVSDVPELEDEAFLFLDPAKATVIRELASEEEGGLLLVGSGIAPLWWSSEAFTDLRLVPPRGEHYTYFYAPSFNPSPPMKGFGLAILRVREAGATASQGGKPADVLHAFRRVGAHAYVDQT